MNKKQILKRLEGEAKKWLERAAADRSIQDRRDLVQRLSLRELEVLESADRPDKLIAAEMQISPHTVRDYWRRIFRKLSTKDRREATRILTAYKAKFDSL